MMKHLSLTALACLSLVGVAQAQTPTQSVTVYSARNEQLIKPLFDAYTKETGVEVKVLTDKEGPLMARLQAEGVILLLIC